MSNVVGFTKREALVWCCAACGCSTFKLYEGGITECAGCELQGFDNGEWINEPPEPAGPVKTSCQTARSSRLEMLLPRPRAAARYFNG